MEGFRFVLCRLCICPSIIWHHFQGSGLTGFLQATAFKAVCCCCLISWCFVSDGVGLFVCLYTGSRWVVPAICERPEHVKSRAALLRTGLRSCSPGRSGSGSDLRSLESAHSCVLCGCVGKPLLSASGDNTCRMQASKEGTLSCSL